MFKNPVIIEFYIKDIKLIIVGGYGWNYKLTLKLIYEMKQKHDIVFHNYISDENLKFLYQYLVQSTKLLMGQKLLYPQRVLFVLKIKLHQVF